MVSSFLASVVVCCWCVLVLWSVGCCVVGVLSLLCIVCVGWLFVCVALSEILLVVLLLRVWLVVGVCLVCVVSLVCVLLLVLVCFGWSAVLLVGCRGCVALSAFLLLVAPVCCIVLVLVAPGSCVVLLVVGLLVLLSPLFLVRHDQARLCFSWFFFLTFFATAVLRWLVCGFVLLV